jgi:hypothetical protein
MTIIFIILQNFNFLVFIILFHMTHYYFLFFLHPPINPIYFNLLYMEFIIGEMLFFMFIFIRLY